MDYSVGKMAQMMGVAPSTLRYYDKEGLMPFIERTNGGRRVFRDKDVEWLNIIACLKSTGMSVADIKTFIDMTLAGDQTIEERLRMFERQRETVRTKLAELQNTLDILDYKCWYYEQAKLAGTTELPANLPDESLPDNIRSIRKRLHCFENQPAEQ